MDTIIQQYVGYTYHPELATEILRAFSLYQQLDSQYDELPYINLLARAEERHKEDTQDQFFALISSKITELLKAHSIEIVPETSLRKKSEILEALIKVQDLGDSSSIRRILDLSLDPKEKLTMLLEELTTVDESDLFVAIESFSPELLDRIHDMVALDEQPETVSGNDKERIAIIKRLATIYPGTRPIGLVLLSSGVAVNQPLMVYFDYTQTYFQYQGEKPTAERIAIDILSLILLTTEGVTNPMKVYNDNGSKIFDSLQMVTRINVAIMAILTKMENHHEEV